MGVTPGRHGALRSVWGTERGALVFKGDIDARAAASESRPERQHAAPSPLVHGRAGRLAAASVSRASAGGDAPARRRRGRARSPRRAACDRSTDRAGSYRAGVRSRAPWLAGGQLAHDLADVREGLALVDV